MASPEASPKFDLHSEEIIVEFDRARHDNQFVDLEAAVSQVPGEIRPRLLAELACIDLEHLFERGQMVTISPFLMLYPDMFKQHAMREIVAKEHYRLCCISGANVSPAEIAQRYCVEGGAWTALPRGEPCPTSKIDIPDIAFPEVGSTFCDYLLIAELGRGALARVYIAKQPDLAERWVVLKVTQRHTAEADQLAQLQHSGIIPVYSIHRERDLHCICMPYLGAVTLRDLLSDGRLFSHSPSPCHALASTIVSERLSTIVASTHTPKGSAAFLRPAQCIGRAIPAPDDCRGRR